MHEVANATIFFSWQSDIAKHRNIISKSLKKAIELTGKYIYDEATRNVLGAVDIPSQALKKIQEAHIFVADLSIVNKNSVYREMPNPNVMFEMGFALSQLGESRVILIAEKGIDIPFDIEHFHSIKCDFTDEPEKYLTKELHEILELYKQNETLNRTRLADLTRKLASDIAIFLQEGEEDKPPFKHDISGNEQAMKKQWQESVTSHQNHEGKIRARLYSKYHKDLMLIISNLKSFGVLTDDQERSIFWKLNAFAFADQVSAELVEAAKRLEP